MFTSCINLTCHPKIPHSPAVFNLVIICTKDSCLQILNILVYSTFTSIQKHLPIPVSLSIMSCSTGSSLANSTRSPPHFTVQITCPTALQFPNPWRVSLVRSLLYKWNRMCDSSSSLHTFSPLGPFVLSCSDPWNICQSIFLCGSQYHQLPLGSALIWSILHGKLPSASRCRKNTTTLIYIQSSFRYFQHPSDLPSSFSSSKSKLIFSKSPHKKTQLGTVRKLHAHWNKAEHFSLCLLP